MGANTPNSNYIFQRPPNQGMEMKDGAAILRDLENASSVGLSTDGSEAGATTQTQVFTNGVQLDNLTASSILIADATKKIVSGGVLTGQATLFPQVNATADGFNFVAITGSTTTDAGVPTARAATTAVLPGVPVYNNGAAGVGRTLTRGSNGTLGTIDGITSFQVGDKILVKNQAASLQNGLYEVTVVGVAGGGGAAYVLTGTTDSDDTAEFDEQVIAVSSGSTNAGTTWGQTTVNPTVGTDPIVYVAQTGTFMTQAPQGTQAVNQIPYYVAAARRLSRGEAAFTYDPATNTLSVPNIIMNDGGTGAIGDGAAVITFAAGSLNLQDNFGNVIDMQNASGVGITAGTGDLLLSASAGAASLSAAAGLASVVGNSIAMVSTTTFSLTLGGDADFTTVGGNILFPSGTTFSGSGRITAGLTISTADPGSGAGQWRLGTVITAASVFDGTRYLQVDVGGTVYGIALNTI